MAAADNPYYIQPANPLQALMTGVQGYEGAQKRTKEADIVSARERAKQIIQSGGDIRNVLGELMNDPQMAKVAADYAQNQSTSEHQRLTLAAQEKFHAATSAQQAAALRATVEHQRRTEEHASTTPVKLGQSLTGEIYGVRDPSQPSGYRVIDESQFKPPPLPSPASSSGGGGGQPSVTEPPVSQTPAILSGGAPKLHGDEFLKSIDPKVHELIKGVANYEIAPTTFSNRGQRERILNAVKQYDPTFDEKIYGDRYLAKKRFSSGPQGDIIRSMNVGIDHLSTLEEYALALHNGDVRVINMAKNKFKEQFGYDAPVNFDAVKSIVGAEISKAIIGSRGALEDRREIREPLNRAGAPDQILGPIKAYKKLMGGQVIGLKQQHDATGLTGFEKKLTPATLRELGINEKGERIQPSGNGDNSTKTGVKWSIE